jgi:DNA-damage-inducible protein D
MLKERGVLPEQLPPAEDVKKLQRKLETEEKKIAKQTKRIRKGKNS